MCKICLESALEFFPNIPMEEVGDWLLSCTCYPFGDGLIEREQIKALRAKTSNYQDCYGIADEDLTRETSSAPWKPLKRLI